MRRPVRLGLAILIVSACSAPEPPPAPEAQAPPEVELYRSPAMAPLGLPFSDAARVGNLILLSGQIGNKPGTMGLVEGGIAPETRQTMANIGAVLEGMGASLQDVVKCTVFLADIADWPAFNAEYVTFFDEGRLPARSAVEVGGLALGARVEVECVAVAGD